MPTVLIDADGCPVVDLAIRLCKGRKIPVSSSVTPPTA